MGGPLCTNTFVCVNENFRSMRRPAVDQTDRVFVCNLVDKWRAVCRFTVQSPIANFRITPFLETGNGKLENCHVKGVACSRDLRGIRHDRRDVHDPPVRQGSAQDRRQLRRPGRGDEGVEGIRRPARSGTAPYYDGVIFHRVISGFMIQGGDRARHGHRRARLQLRRRVPSHAPPQHAPACCRWPTPGPNTNGSQFFITLGPTPHLDNRHSVFGEVVEGLDVVQEDRRRADRPSGPAGQAGRDEHVTIKRVA